MTKKTTTPAPAPPTATNGRPEWAKRLTQLYLSQIAHGYIVHGNINDLVTVNTPLLKYITMSLIGSWDIIAMYDRAHGITFPFASMRDGFLTLMGLDKPPEKPDPILARAGIKQQNSSNPLDDYRAPSDALPLLDKFLHLPPAKDKEGRDLPADKQPKYAVILNNAETLVPNSDVSRMSPEDRTHMVLVSSWGNDLDISSAGHIILLLTPDLTDIHAQVRSAGNKYESILIDFPTYEERITFVETLAQSTALQFEWQVTQAQLAMQSAGLRRADILDILFRANLEGLLTQTQITTRKKDIISGEYAQVAQVVTPTAGWESIAGLQHIKDYHDQVIYFMRNGDYLLCPTGILYLGPAGTGKTAFATAFAYMSKYNLLYLQLDKIMGKYVGDSEKNIASFIRMARAQAPLIIFIDEPDQKINRGGEGDSGVGGRVFAEILQEMSRSENRGKILWVAASNRPDLMDAALRRPGRFDISMVFPPPNDNERLALFQLFAKKQNLGADVIPVEAIRNTKGWTGAEIENVVRKAALIRAIEKMPTPLALISATERILPNTADIDFMMKLAMDAVNDKDLVPEEYRYMLADRQQLKAEIAEGYAQRGETERERAPRRM